MLKLFFLLCEHLRSEILQKNVRLAFTFIFTFMHLADAFIQSNLQCIQAIHFFNTCVHWELNPQPFALLTQCSTTEPQEQDLLYEHVSILSIILKPIRHKEVKHVEFTQTHICFPFTDNTRQYVCHSLYNTCTFLSEITIYFKFLLSLPCASYVKNELRKPLKQQEART